MDANTSHKVGDLARRWRLHVRFVLDTEKKKNPDFVLRALIYRADGADSPRAWEGATLRALETLRSVILEHDGLLLLLLDESDAGKIPSPESLGCVGEPVPFEGIGIATFVSLAQTHTAAA